MTSERGFSFQSVFKYCGFILFLWFLYSTLLAVFLILHIELGFESVGSFFSFLTSDVVGPYLLFFLILLCIQWVRWLYALYCKQDVADTFVERYFLPLFYGSLWTFLIIFPAFGFTFALYSGNSFSDALVTALLYVLLFLPFLLLLLLIVVPAVRSYANITDTYLAWCALLAVFFTALLDFIAQIFQLTGSTILCAVSDRYFGSILFLSIVFFKGTELIIRPYLADGYKPHHTVFGFPVCVVMFALFYVIVLSGTDAICYSWAY